MKIERLRIWLPMVLLAAAASATLCGALDKAQMQTLNVLITQGNALMLKKQYPQALNKYDQALEIDPKNPTAIANIVETHNNWGIQYYNQHKFKEALAEWETCLKINPRHIRSKNNINLVMKVAAEQGVDLMGDEGHGVNHESERVTEDPKDARELPSERQSRENANRDPFGIEETRAPAGQPDAPIGKAQTPLEAPSKDSGQYGDSILIKRTDSGAGNDTPSGATLVFPTAGGAPVPSAAASPVVPGRPTLYPATPPQAVRPYDTTPGAAATAPVPPAAATPPAATTPAAVPTVPPPSAPTPAATAPAMPIEDQLGIVETKVYGRKLTGLTVLQRLEKIETDTCGVVRPGYVFERVEFMRKTYGL